VRFAYVSSLRSMCVLLASDFWCCLQPLCISTCIRAQVPSDLVCVICLPLLTEYRCVSSALRTLQTKAQGRTLIKVGRLQKFDRHGKATPYVFHLFSDAVCYSEETSIGLKLHRLMDLNAGCFAGDNPDPSVPHSFMVCAAAMQQ
jgi:hypothetical protein